MKTLTFSENQCVQINNKQEFKIVYPFLSSEKNGVKYKGWLSAFIFYPNFPIYLEHAGNKGIGYRYSPFSTWNGSPLEILNLNEALK